MQAFTQPAKEGRRNRQKVFRIAGYLSAVPTLVFP